MVQVQIFIDKHDLIGSQTATDFLLNFLMSQDVAGASAFKGWMGFGKNHVLKQSDRFFSFEEPPVLITFVDTDEKVNQVLKELREIYQGGLIVKSQVEVV